MSAFLVSKAHIDALVSATTADIYRSIPMIPSATVRGDPVAFAAAIARAPTEWTDVSVAISGGADNDLFGRALWLANAESLCARYHGDRERLEADGTFAAIRAYRWTRVTLAPVEVIKACHCYDYQSCEVADWDSAWAKRAVDAIEHITVRNLPGYAAAPWGVD